MATLPITGGASAPSNVVQLPTAAARKVDNFRYAEQRRAVVEARKECRWHNLTPLEREKRSEARQMRLTRTPELLLLLGLLKHVSPEIRNGVYREVMGVSLAMDDDEAAQGAFDVIAALVGKGK